MLLMRIRMKKALLHNVIFRKKIVIEVPIIAPHLNNPIVEKSLVIRALKVIIYLIKDNN